MQIKNKYQPIKIESLQVNSDNDRHGELSNEVEAINWMLSNLSERMRKLAVDVAQGEVYDPPLVSNDTGIYTVHDGNRRVSTLKLLNNPSLANDDEWRSFFEKLKSENEGKIPKEVNCRVEDDQDVINEIVFRRHAGGASGIGQMDWDAEGKENHMRRTGRQAKPNLAFEWQVLLRKEGLLGEGNKIPLSNFNRLFSSEALRSRVGFSFKGQKIDFTHDREIVIQAIMHIVDDLICKRVVLDHIWANKDKNRYLDKLKDEGILPNAEDDLSSQGEVTDNYSEAKTTTNDNKVTDDEILTETDSSFSKPKNKRKKPRRLTLIPRDLQIDTRMCMRH